MGVADQSVTRLGLVTDERAQIHARHEAKLAEIATRADTTATEADRQMLTGYRERTAEIDGEIADLADYISREQKADEESRKIRGILTGGNTDGVTADGEGVVYRDFKSYARDMILARSASSSGELAKVAENWGGEDEVMKARTRLELLKRTASTLTSDVPGLSPDQHLAQIFQVIDNSRPIVSDAPRTVLNRLTLTYPHITGKPIVAVQATQKTEAGDVGLDVEMLDATATTYLGGGNISWQAAQFTDPNALDLWFRIVTADYALKTEQDAAEVVSDSGAAHIISSPLGATPSFADFMTAVGKGGAAVFTDLGPDGKPRLPRRGQVVVPVRAHVGRAGDVHHPERAGCRPSHVHRVPRPGGRRDRRR